MNILRRTALVLAAPVLAIVVAGLLTRSLRNAQAFDPGFDSSGLVLARLNLDRKYGTF